MTWQTALVVGFGLALSSTALVIASLPERGQLLTQHGREVFTAAALLSLFKQHDEARLEEQHAFQHDEAHLIQTAQEAAAQLKDLFEPDTAYFPQAGAAAAAS